MRSMRAILLPGVLFGLLAAFLLFSIPVSAAVMPTFPDEALFEGDTGSSVRSLNEALSTLGLLEGDDSEYGEPTVAAVRQLQRTLGLPASGAYDEATFLTAIEAAEQMNISLSVLLSSTIEEEHEAVDASVDNLDNLHGKIIGIDAGHQLEADNVKEAISPNSTLTKDRTSAGGVGTKTGIYEYEINLQIANRLKLLLEDAGATVIMTRSTHDVNISNSERAVMMNDANVDVWVRIHCDHSTDSQKSGISVIAPSKDANEAIAQESLSLAKQLIESTSEQSGVNALNISILSDQTGFNFSKSPVVAMELGFLSNPTEDVLLNRASHQESLALGMAKGLNAYFG